MGRNRTMRDLRDCPRRAEFGRSEWYSLQVRKALIDEVVEVKAINGAFRGRSAENVLKDGVALLKVAAEFAGFHRQSRGARQTLLEAAETLERLQGPDQEA